MLGTHFLLDIRIWRLKKLFHFTGEISTHLSRADCTHCTQRQAHDVLRLMIQVTVNVQHATALRITTANCYTEHTSSLQIQMRARCSKFPFSVQFWNTGVILILNVKCNCFGAKKEKRINPHNLWDVAGMPYYHLSDIWIQYIITVTTQRITNFKISLPIPTINVQISTTVGSTWCGSYHTVLTI